MCVKEGVISAETPRADKEKTVMVMETERQEIVEYGKRISSEGLAKGTAGNISIYDPDTGLMAVSPSGIGYFDTMPEDVVVMTLDGKIVDGARKPSSEYGLHAVIYRIKPEARAVVHTHSKYCTALACMREPLKPYHYVIAAAGTAAVPCAEYATFGTPELAEKVREALGESRAVLLANHGLVACGADLDGAFSLAVNCEFCAELQWMCECAGENRGVVLSEQEMEAAMERFRSYGQTDNSSSGQTKGY